MNSLSDPPPLYLIKLLGYFHWKVANRQDKADKYRYVSPNGISYFSHRLAYEAFLEGTSMYSENGSILSRHLQKRSYFDTSSYLGIGRHTGGWNIKKKRTGRRKRMTNVENKTISLSQVNHTQLMNTNITSYSKFNGPLKRKNPEIPINENYNTRNRKLKERRRGGCGLSIRSSRKDDHHDEIIPQRKLNIVTQLIEFGTLAENDKIYYLSKNSTATTAAMVTKNGIWCFCCKELVSLSKLVAHANGTLELYYENIFLLSGKSFLSVMKEAWEKEKVQRKVGYKNIGLEYPDPSDDTCAMCADGGHLICCDSCPSTFHQSCLMLETFPKGRWYCPYCKCKICRTHGLENMLSCKECGHKYHKASCQGNDMQSMGLVPFPFCGKSCKIVSDKLRNILGRRNQTVDGCSWTLLKYLDEDVEKISSERLSFIMESNLKLSMALCVLDECFDSLIDRRTGIDMLCQAVYNCGSNYKRLNYEGFYTLILEKDEDIISVALLRLHGTSLAEMPFVCTRFMYRKQGMCRRLVKEIENMLCELHVEKLVIPTVPDMLEIWTKSFSFKPLELSHKEEIKNLSLVLFTGTTLLQKPMHLSTPVLKDVVTDNSAKGVKNTPHTKALISSFCVQGNGAPHFRSHTSLAANYDIQKHIDPISNFNRTYLRSPVKDGQNTRRDIEIENQNHHGSEDSIGKSQNIPTSQGNEMGLNDSHVLGFYGSILEGNVDTVNPPKCTAMTNINCTIPSNFTTSKALVSSTKFLSTRSNEFVPKTSKADRADAANSSNANLRDVPTDNSAKCMKNTQQKKAPTISFYTQGNSAQININKQRGHGNSSMEIPEQPKLNINNHPINKGLSRNLEIQNQTHHGNQDNIQKSPSLLISQSNGMDLNGSYDLELYANFLKGHVDLMKPPNDIDTTNTNTIPNNFTASKAEHARFVAETTKTDCADAANSSNADVSGQSEAFDAVKNLEMLAI